MLDYATTDALSQFDGHELKSTAVYFAEMDYVDYIRRDCVQVSQRIDHFLTLIWDDTMTDLVGFRIKGINNVFLNKLKPAFNLSDEHFIPVRDLFVLAVTEFAEEFFDNGAKKDNSVRLEAYKKAAKMATDDHVCLDQELFDLAA